MYINAKLKNLAFHESSRMPIVFALVLISTFFISSCSHHKYDLLHSDHVNKQNLLSTSVMITNAGTTGELFPSAAIFNVSKKYQNFSLFAYSEYGRKCEILGTNSYTTDSSDPRGCDECNGNCPASEVTGKKLEVFAPSPLGSKKSSALDFPVQSIYPVVGVRHYPANKTSKLGRYVSSRSPDKISGYMSSACYGPLGRCGGISESHTHHASLTDPLASTALDYEPNNFTYPQNNPFLAFHGGPHFAGFGNRGVASVGLDPMISTIAEASGNSIKSFPATVKLTTGIGRTIYRSIAKTAVGETVYEAFLRNAKNEKIPLWHIRLLFGQQVNNDGFSIEVNSADILKWHRAGKSSGKERYLSDREVARLLFNHLEISVDSRDLKAELRPRDGDYIPLHYQVSLEEDAELIEKVQSSAIDEDLRNPTCKQ